MRPIGNIPSVENLVNDLIEKNFNGNKECNFWVNMQMDEAHYLGFANNTYSLTASSNKLQYQLSPVH